MKNRTVATIAGLATIALMGMVPASPVFASSAKPGARDAGLIVAQEFSDLNDGNSYIYSIRPDGTHKKILTSGFSDRGAELSPDGRQIVFLRCTDVTACDDIGKVNVWLMNADGTHQHALTHCDGTNCLGAGTATFSPDGRWVAYGLDQLDSHGVNFEGIFVQRTDGTHLTRITINGSDNPPDEDPQYSPDGRSLVFDRENPDGTTAIATVRLDGSHLRILDPSLNAFSPDWSSQGQITFTLHHDVGDSDVTDIGTMRPDGGHVRLLTSSVPGLTAFLSAYSPDGCSLVYTQVNPDGGGDLTTIPANGGTPHAVATSANFDAGAGWGVLVHVH